jgi:hypothetical protein
MLNIHICWQIMRARLSLVEHHGLIRCLGFSLHHARAGRSSESSRGCILTMCLMQVMSEEQAAAHHYVPQGHYHHNHKKGSKVANGGGDAATAVDTPSYQHP